ncbi:unnamed protein product [Amoebophrya sp. A120]|nr:unnamed protein product [Amoebophrya sp. A120]|eukprot:GSA120T00014514001.1
MEQQGGAASSSNPPGGAGGGSKDDDAEPEVKIEGESFGFHNLHTIRNAKIRAEVRLKLQRQKAAKLANAAGADASPKSLAFSPSGQLLPIKILDQHGNKTSNKGAASSNDVTETVDVEKIQKSCLGLGNPSFLERVKMEFDLKQRPQTAPSDGQLTDYVSRNKNKTNQFKLSEREKIYAKIKQERFHKELRVTRNLNSAKREKMEGVINSGVSYLNKMAYLQEEGKYARKGLLLNTGAGGSGPSGKNLMMTMIPGFAQFGKKPAAGDEEVLDEEWRIRRWAAFMLQQSFASIMHRLLLNNSPDARKRYNEGRWCAMVRVFRFIHKLKRAVRGTKVFRFLFKIARVRYRLLIKPRIKKFHAQRLVNFLARTTPSVPIIEGLKRFFEHVKCIQTKFRTHLSLMQPFLKQASHFFEQTEGLMLKELQTYVQVERPVRFAEAGKDLLGKTEPGMLSGRRLNEREHFVAEYKMPAEVRDAFLTAELVERLYVRMQRNAKQKLAFKSSMGFIHDYTHFWRPTFDVNFFDVLKDQVDLQDDDVGQIPCQLVFTKPEMELIVVAMHRTFGLLPGSTSKYSEEIDKDPNGFQTENALEFKERYFMKKKPGVTCRSMRERLQRRVTYFVASSRGMSAIDNEDEENEGKKELIKDELVLRESDSAEASNAEEDVGLSMINGGSTTAGSGGSFRRSGSRMEVR